MLVETSSESYVKARSVNETSNGYVSRVPTNTEPSGDAATATGASIIDLGRDGGVAPNGLVIIPYAVASADQTFSLRVIGWRKVITQWIPVNLGEFACTAGTAAGAGGDILTTELFADTITVTVGSTLSGEAPSENIISPANNTIASILLDLKGHNKVEVRFTTGGSATSCNALLARV